MILKNRKIMLLSSEVKVIAPFPLGALSGLCVAPCCYGFCCCGFRWLNLLFVFSILEPGGFGCCPF